MAKTVKIKTTAPHRFGRRFQNSVCFIEFDNKGIAEVDAEDVDKLLALDPNLKLAKKEIEITEVIEEDEIIPEKELEDLTKNQLIEIAGDAKFPEEEWKNLNKIKLLEYIKTKI